MRVCSGAGCLRAIDDNTRFCSECQPQPQPVEESEAIRSHTLADRERYARLYTGLRWHRLRATVLRAQPMCARCGRELSAIVDHVVPAGFAVVQAQQSGRFPFDRFAGFFLRSNLQGLCRACHWVKTCEDKAHTGPWPDVVGPALQSKSPRAF